MFILLIKAVFHHYTDLRLLSLGPSSLDLVVTKAGPPSFGGTDGLCIPGILFRAVTMAVFAAPGAFYERTRPGVSVSGVPG